jgi:lipopolysaccharide/colanic/teichoic acid biosynthesis glycosyltransferase
MSLVGPRPEVPYYVWEHYTARDMETLRVLPGLTSPATLYDYTHGEQILAQGNVEQMYLKKLLPVRLALDTVYVHEANFFYDLRIIFRTIVVMVLIALGKRKFPDPPAMDKVRIEGASDNPARFSALRRDG